MNFWAIGLSLLGLIMSLTMTASQGALKAEMQQEKLFWQEYFFAEKKYENYILELGDGIELEDILKHIMTFYRMSIRESADTLRHSLFTRSIRKSRDLFAMCRGDLFTVTSDEKYLISVNIFGLYQRVTLYDAATLAPIKDFADKEAFIYLEKSNKIVIYHRQAYVWENMHPGTIIIYDVATDKESIIDCAYNNTMDLTVEKEKYCFVGSTVYDLETMTRIESLQGCGEYTLNQAKDLIIGFGMHNDNEYRLCLFPETENGFWRIDQEDYRLPFVPDTIHCMKDDYIVLSKNGRRESDFLHLHIERYNNAFKIVEVKKSAGAGCVVRQANKDFFTCWKDDKSFRLVAYDGSLVKDVDDFFEGGAQFSKDGKHYVAACSPQVVEKRARTRFGESGNRLNAVLRTPDWYRSFLEDFPCASTDSIRPNKPLLLLLLDPVQKSAQEVASEGFKGGSDSKTITFHNDSSMFLVRGHNSASLGTMRGKKLGFLKGHNNYEWDFSAQDNSVIHRDEGIKYLLPSKKVLSVLGELSMNQISFAEYFLLKRNCGSDCTKKLREKSRDNYKLLYDAANSK